MATINISPSSSGGSWDSVIHSVRYGNSSCVYYSLHVVYVKNVNRYNVSISLVGYKLNGSITAPISNLGTKASFSGNWTSKGSGLSWTASNTSSLTTNSGNPTTMARIVTNATLSAITSNTSSIDVTIEFRIAPTGGSAGHAYATESITFIVPQLAFTASYYDTSFISSQNWNYGNPITLKAKLTSKTNKWNYTYTYSGSSAKGGTKTATQSVVFRDWYDGSTGTGYEAGRQYYFFKDMHFDARWTKGDINYPTVTVDKSAKKNNEYNSYYYYVYFYSQGAHIDTKSTNEGRQTITYNPLRYYTSSVNGNKYGGAEGATNMTLTADTTLTATWSYSITDKQPLRLSGIPSNPSRRGYKFAGWFDEGGSQVTAGMTIDHDFNAYAQWTPKVYNVQYVINGDKNQTGQWINGTKTYGESDFQISSSIPTKFGYTFAGWSTEDGDSRWLQCPGEWLNDNIYNRITDLAGGTEPTTIRLYAKWVPIQNKVRWYCWFNDEEQTTVDESYTVEDLKTYNNVQCYYYKEAPTEQRGSDYVFIGWCLNKPDDWETRHGVYNIADEAPENVLPFYVKKNDITEASQWDGKISNYLWGIWSKTGKYVKLPSGWKKVNMAYVKVNGAWKPVHDFYTCTQSAEYDDQGNLIQEAIWKHEI